MEKLKSYITRKQINKKLGKESYDSLIERSKNIFRNSDLYSGNRDLKDLISEMKIDKRNQYAYNWFEWLGLAMATTSCFRFDNYPNGQMLAMMCSGLAGSIVAHYIKKRVKEKYKSEEQELVEYLKNADAMSEIYDQGFSAESLGVVSSDVCDKIVDSQSLMDCYWEG